MPNNIPMIKEYEGVQYPATTLDPNDCTLKDQITDLLDAADQAFAENDVEWDETHDPAFPLIDAVKLLNAAIERLNFEKNVPVAAH
jgi:hypothetical protein|tara:strand:- start:370 stop:627 length:258 start_codon:yes stop_codon:yes gene_type:complete